MRVFESSRKVQSIGSSLAVTLPSFFVKINEIEKGMKTEVYYDLNGTLIFSTCDNSDDLKNNLAEILNNVIEKLQLTKSNE